MPITDSPPGLRGITMKAGADVSTVVILAMSAGPAHADESPEAELTDAIGVVNQYWSDHFTEHFGSSYMPPDLVTGPSVGIDGFYDSSVDQVTCGGQVGHSRFSARIPNAT